MGFYAKARVWTSFHGEPLWSATSGIIIRMHDWLSLLDERILLRLIVYIKQNQKKHSFKPTTTERTDMLRRHALHALYSQSNFVKTFRRGLQRKHENNLNCEWLKDFNAQPTTQGELVAEIIRLHESVKEKRRQELTAELANSLKRQNFAPISQNLRSNTGPTKTRL